MLRARPRKEAMFNLCNWKFLISLKPQQVWEYDKDSATNPHIVRYKNVSIRLSDEEFEKYFREVGNE